MNVNVVTSFSPDGWKTYGRRFVDSFLRYWPYRLTVFAEGQDVPPGYQGIPALRWLDLKDDPEHEAFCVRNAGKDHPTDFNEMPVRFGHKVFAITSPLLPADGWRVWIDADTETVAPVEPQHLNALFPPAKALTFLGRRGWMRPGQPCYSECGFVAYNLDDAGSAVLDRMRSIFVDDEVLRQGPHNMHDSYTFDRVRSELTIAPQWNNLSGHVPAGEFHVWPKTVLGEIMVHHKGPKRKREAYGQ